jgi:hypothetical protein
MRELKVERHINASPGRVWRILTDTRTLGSGAFGITRIEGDIVKGGKLKLWSSASPGRAFPLTVAEMEPGRSMVWKGGMPLGLFTGTRTFTLSPTSGGTHFRMREAYEGPMTELIWKSMPDLNPSFELFGTALTSLAEA